MSEIGEVRAKNGVLWPSAENRADAANEMRRLEEAVGLVEPSRPVVRFTPVLSPLFDPALVVQVPWPKWLWARMTECRKDGHLWVAEEYPALYFVPVRCEHCSQRGVLPLYAKCKVLRYRDIEI